MRRRSRAPGVPRVVLLTDRTQLPAEHCLVETVIECHRAGLEAVVVREHDLEPYARRALLAQLARLPGLWVISSRIPDPSAHGLHLAAHQPAPRPLVGLARRWGRSCHSRADVERAAGEGAAWVTLSPFAPSASKPGYGPALARSVWARSDWAQSATAPSAGAENPIPVLALGGITPDNAAQARAAGAHGVAVMGEVMRAPDPGDVVTRLLEAV